MKKTARSKAKDNAWDAFSKYIRTRDCLRFSGFADEGKCVTCYRDYPYSKLQAGHFVPGRGNAVLFDEEVVFSQCIGCNGNPPYGKGGNYIEYFLFMEREVGRAKIDELLARKHLTVVYKQHDFERIKDEYQYKYEMLLK